LTEYVPAPELSAGVRCWVQKGSDVLGVRLTEPDPNQSWNEPL